jgi:hypothetical protein
VVGRISHSYWVFAVLLVDCAIETHLLELLDLGLVEHGEDVRGGPLAAPLRVLLARCLGPALYARGRRENNGS